MGLPDVRKLRQFQNNPELACDDINELIDHQMTQIHQKIEALQLLEQQLHILRESCHSHARIRDCGILKNLEQAAKGENCDCHAETDLKNA
jgi:ABC-type phosphate transport system auxiliary subunit